MTPRRHYRPLNPAHAGDRLIYAAGVAYRASILAGAYDTGVGDHVARRLRERRFDVGQLLATIEDGQIVSVHAHRGRGWLAVGYLSRLLVIAGAYWHPGIEFASVLPTIATVYEPDALTNEPLHVPVREYVHREIAELLGAA